MLLPHGLLVLVIDGSRMQLLCNRGSEAKPKLELVDHDRIKTPPTRLLGADKPGRSFESSSGARHSYSETDLHERREQEFAAAAMDLLAGKAAQDARIILIAPPRMLGYLRKHVPTELQRQVLAMFDRDLAKDHPDEICRFLIDLER